MTRRLVSILFLALFVCLGAWPFEFFEPVTPPRAFQVMAHRGMMRQAPENTRPAIELAIEDGIEWVEVDVRLTKDGQHVILHNDAVDGVTDGMGKVADLTLDAIKQLDAGAWFAPRYVGERILTLAECLALAKGRINLYLDCKAVDPDLLAREIAEAGMERQVAVFDDVPVLLKVRAASNGTIPIMPKWHPANGQDKWFERVKPDTVEIDADEVTAEICAWFHGKGVKVQAKVLDDADTPAVWDRMIEAGVDWLQTDRAEDILAHRFWKSRTDRPVLMSLHRGALRYAPENTIPAIEKAVELGSDLIEIDVRTSKDGKYYLLHDDTLDKTTDVSGLIRDYTSEQIAALDAGAWFGKPFAGTRIPAFDEGLAAIAGHAGVYLDAKDVTVEVIAAKLDEYKLTDCSVVYGSPVLLKKLKAINPKIRALCPLGSPKQVEKMSETLAPYAFDASWEILSKDLIDRCHALGIKVFSDAIGEHDNVADYTQAIAWGIDLIQTDHPLLVIRAAELLASGK